MRVAFLVLLALLGLFAVSAYGMSSSSLSSAELTSQEINEVYNEFYGEEESEESFLEADADADAEADAEADVDAEADAEAEVEAEAGEEQTAVTKCGKKITWERNQEPNPEATLLETETEKPIIGKRPAANSPAMIALAKKNAAAKKAGAKPAAASPVAQRLAATPATGSCRKGAAAAAYAVSHVSSKRFGQGQCAKFVGNALAAAGFKSIVGQPNACQKGPALLAAGFVKLPNLNNPQIGDVWMYACVPTHPSGHLQIFTAKGWTSDFVQAHNNPWAGGKTGGSTATAFRPAPSVC